MPAVRSGCGVVLLMATLCGPARADLYINPTASTISFVATGPSVFGVKYRISNGNWDQSLGNTTSTATPANYLQRNQGTVASLSGRVVDFALEHRPGLGLRWTLTQSGTSWSQTWGDVTLGGDQRATLLNGIAPNRRFNTLQLEMRGQNSGANLGQAAWSDLTFAGDLGPVFGRLVAAGATSPTAGGPTFFQRTPGAGFHWQWIHSTWNLSTRAWTLSGKVTLTKNYTGGDESVRFGVSGFEARAVGIAPEPGAGALLTLGIALLGYAARRRR